MKSSKYTKYSKEDQPPIPNILASHIFQMKCAGQISFKFEDLLPNWMYYFGVFASSFYQILLTFLSGHLALFYVKSSWDSFLNNDINGICDAMMCAIIYSFSFFGVIYWMVKEKSLITFLDFISTNLVHRSFEGYTYVNIRRSFNIARLITISWKGSCVVSVLFWSILPMINKNKSLPLRCWYPFDPLQSGFFEIIYLVQVFGQLHIAFVFSNISSLYITLVLLFSSQYDILFCNIKNFLPHSQIKAGVDIKTLKMEQNEIDLDREEANQYLISIEHITDLNVIVANNGNYSKNNNSDVELKRHLQITLKKCVVFHLFILKCAALMEETFYQLCFIKSFQITFQMCFMAFVIVVVEKTLANIINVLQLLTLTMYELFMYTYFGELLKYQSLRINESVVRSMWYKHAVPIKKELSILIANCNKPVKLTAGKILIMDVSRLKSVITTSFSFLTLLLKLSNKKESLK